MPFFADTNLALGYTIIHDKHHKNANDLINKTEDNIFWSNLVKDEYERKLNSIFDDIDIFLKSTEKILKNNEKDFLNQENFENYILNETKRCKLDKIKKQKILEHYWNKYSFIDGIANVIYSKFRNFNKNFKKMYFMRDKKINKILILHDCGLNNYLKYLNYATKLLEWGVHNPDCKIIVDAHNCGKEQDDLIFVSTDDKLIDIIHEHDTSFLNIIEFRSCN